MMAESQEGPKKLLFKGTGSEPIWIFGWIFYKAGADTEDGMTPRT